MSAVVRLVHIPFLLVTYVKDIILPITNKNRVIEFELYNNEMITPA